MHKNASNPLSVSGPQIGVVGARGYSGLELIRLLLKHPSKPHITCAASEAFDLADYLPEAFFSHFLSISSIESMQTGNPLHTVFLATPAEVSAELAQSFRSKGAAVIDLSGAFRLPVQDYARWYAPHHPDPEGCSLAHYGLQPFAGPAPKPSKVPALISNPGCYATAVQMALIPLLKAGCIDPARIVIDAKSGTSGAGRKASENQIFTEVEGECWPYRVGRHQHLPEITRHVGLFTQQTIDPMFNTHLLPTRRGILASMYLTLNPGIRNEHIHSAFAAAFEGYPLVRFGEIEASTGKKGWDPLVSLKRVVGTARTQISWKIQDNSKLYLFSVLDNLLKGAASQAIENYNHLLGLPPETGLTQQEGIL